MGGEEIFTAESGEPSEEFNDTGFFQSGSGGNDIFFGDGSGMLTVGASGGENGTGNTSQEFGSITGAEKEETPFLVNEEEIISGQALEDAIVSALEAVFGNEDISNITEAASDPTPTPVQSVTDTPTPAPVYDHDIDDIYERLDSIENIQSLLYSDAVSYHKGQDIIGRVEIGILSILIGGLVVVGFIGRIR